MFRAQPPPRSSSRTLLAPPSTCQYQTILHASPPRTECTQHGVKVVKLPWAEAGARFTALFEALAIEWMKASSQKAVAQLLGLSWHEIHGIQERAVQRGLERRKQEPYIDSVREHLPAAEKKIVFDKFHIAKHLGEAVDQVRRKEHRALKAEGDQRLTGTKYHWLRDPALMDSEQRREFLQLRQSDLKTARAWALKETGMALYNYVYEKPAREHFQWWHNWAVRSRLAPMKKVASMLKRRFENIITYLTHPITNATSESINAKIQWVKYTARGFRNKQNFINAIYFHCGGLDLAPSSHYEPT